MAALNLIEETIKHFHQGAKTVRAYSADATYVITRANESGQFWVAVEEEGFHKKKTDSLEELYQDVFGIQATY